MIGTKIGPFEVLGKLGEGGMGEVYSARDTRLDRVVAIKVLPATLAADPIFRERFEREARTLSALNHPNICTVFDVGRHDGVAYLVMEYLEGRTLGALVERSPLPPEDALRIARQIADALAAAHRVGVVHRDLKPANIIITGGRGPGGAAKLLDFGLAKRAAVVASAVTGISDPTALHTRTMPLTGTGTILGTFQYMAPEQIEGREADARADIWAFGCVLYEMLTGRRPFQAPTHAGLIAAILDRQPAPVELPSAALTPALNRLIDACLAKDPDERFQTIRDVRRQMEWLAQPGGAPVTTPDAGRRRIVIAAFAGVVAAISLGFMWFVLPRLQSATPNQRPAVFTIQLDSRPHTVGPTGLVGGAGSGTPVVSPDGTRVAFLAHSATETTIWVRDLAKIAPVQLTATSGARGVFWSPDGASLGFFANGKLKTIDVASGRIETLCDAPLGFGGTWSGDTILFSPDERTPIFKVSAQGGASVQVTTLVPDKEHAHRWPHYLPDGRHFIYMPWLDGSTDRQIMLGSLDGSAPRTLFDAQSGAVPAGDHILYVADRPARLMARPFDLRTLAVTGKAVPAILDENVDYQWYTGEPNASVGGSTLAYTTGKYRRTQLTWVNRSGRPLETVGDVGVYFDPALSPDGSMLAIEKSDAGRGGSGDIWTVDLARGAFTRLTSAAGFETTPVWSHDGRVAYASDQSSVPHIFVNSATAAGAESLLVETQSRSFPLDWSADGRYVVYMVTGATTRSDIWMYDVARKTMAPVLASPFNEGWARISPDGKWIAYVSDESQHREVYVRSFPGGAVKVQISNAGGHEPQWRRDGRELFYIAPDNTIMAAEVRSAPGRLDAEKPQALFTANVDQDKSIRNQYAVSADGQRFLILSLVDPNASPIVTVLHWRGLLRD